MTTHRAHTLAVGRMMLLLALAGGLPWSARAHASQPMIEFDMVPSAGAQTCLADATAHVKVQSKGPVETLDLTVSGLPPNTAFAVFVIQVPDSPFGLSWYLGDLETNAHGKRHAKFVGRFSVETFAVAPGSAAAPVVHAGAFPDASLNPSFNPIHTYHLGVWFDSHADATAAGCAAALTPFNGDHAAGIQALSTRNFPNDQGPLRQLAP